MLQIPFLHWNPEKKLFFKYRSCETNYGHRKKIKKEDQVSMNENNNNYRKPLTGSGVLVRHLSHSDVDTPRRTIHPWGVWVLTPLDSCKTVYKIPSHPTFRTPSVTLSVAKNWDQLDTDPRRVLVDLVLETHSGSNFSRALWDDTSAPFLVTHLFVWR